MHHLKSATLFVAAALGAASSAFAGAGLLTTVVTPLSPAVTYSRLATTTARALDTYVGYTVTVASDPSNTNTINNVVFTGTITVTDAQEAAEYISSDGATCQTTTNPLGSPANARSISCTIGQLRAGQPFPTFAVFFKAPVKDTTAPLTPDGVAGLCATTDCVAFGGITFYAEGTGGVQSPPQNSTVPWAADLVTLGTANPTLVKSGVQKSGGLLFTGDGAVATENDPWTTTVIVPANFSAPTGTYTVATIDEPQSEAPLASNLFTKQATILTIPGTFASLTILLRRDATTIAPKAKIDSARVYYSSNNIDLGTQLFSCAITGGPTLGMPCISKPPKEYTRKNSPTPAWIGDWEFEILALDNGRYSN